MGSRPPYSACNSNCERNLGDFGYHVTYFDLDTQGYLNDSPSLIQDSKDIWDAAMEDANSDVDKFLQIEHDPVYQTVYNLTDYILESLTRNGFRAVTVGECLDDPKSNWYRTVSGSEQSEATTTSTTSTRAPSPTSTLPSTVNGRCGAAHRDMTCIREPLGATCCSRAGWCGSSPDHCGPGCQSAFGTCE